MRIFEVRHDNKRYEIYYHPQMGNDSLHGSMPSAPVKTISRALEVLYCVVLNGNLFVSEDPGPLAVLKKERVIIPRMERCPREGCGGTFPHGQTCPTCGYPGLKSTSVCPHAELYLIHQGRNAGKLGCLAAGCKAVFESERVKAGVPWPLMPPIPVLSGLYSPNPWAVRFRRAALLKIVKAPLRPQLRPSGKPGLPKEFYGENKYIALYVKDVYGLINVRQCDEAGTP